MGSDRAGSTDVDVIAEAECLVEGGRGTEASGHARKRSHRDGDDKKRDHHHRHHRHRSSSGHGSSSHRHRSHDRHERHDKHESRRKSEKRREAREPPCQLTGDDYFLRNAEFSVWLERHRGKTFQSLDSSDQRRYFGKFVAKWNAGELEEDLYSGVDKVTSGTRTSYRWNFAEKNRKESPRATSRDDSDGGESRERHRAEKKRRREQEKVAMEEMFPKPDVGSAAHRREQREKRGPQRPPSPDEEPDMGGSTLSSFQKRLIKEKARKKKAMEKRHARVEELKQREAERMEAFREQMGLPSSSSANAPGSDDDIGPVPS